MQIKDSLVSEQLLISPSDDNDYTKSEQNLKDQLKTVEHILENSGGKIEVFSDQEGFSTICLSMKIRAFANKE